MLASSLEGDSKVTGATSSKAVSPAVTRLGLISGDGYWGRVPTRISLVTRESYPRLKTGMGLGIYSRGMRHSSSKNRGKDMKSRQRAIIATAIACATIALSTAAAAKSPRKVKMNEAMAFENSIIAANKAQPAPPVPEKLYTQPGNKAEPCKLPTSKDQLERKNFRAYWDGDCKDGYAFGLGRDIAISDTHHLEEITIHGQLAPEKERPSSGYDFVNNSASYGAVIDSSLERSGSWQRFLTAPDGSLSIQQTTGIFGKASALSLQSSPFLPVTVVTNVQVGQPAYRFQDFSAVPATSDQASGILMVFDPSTQKGGGFGVGRLRGGAVVHREVDADGKPSGQFVQLPQEYVNHLLEKIAEAQPAINKANAAVQRAQQMEREYLYMACNNSYAIKGVPTKDLAMTREICTWRDQWKEPYARAQANSQQQMEQLRQQVAAREQQQAQNFAFQQQLAAQQAAANATAMAVTNNNLQQTVNNLMQQNQQSIQQMQNYNNQMFNSGWNTRQNPVTCITLSNGMVRCN